MNMERAFALFAFATALMALGLPACCASCAYEMVVP